LEFKKAIKKGIQHLLIYFFNLAFFKKRKKSYSFSRLIHSMDKIKKGKYLIKIDSIIFTESELNSFDFEPEELKAVWLWFQNSEKRKDYFKLSYFYLTTFIFFNLIKTENVLLQLED